MLLIYEQTRFDLQVPVPWILTVVNYAELYSYFAYELPFMPTWATTQAGNDYFMKKQQGLPVNEILQYEAEQNTHLLYNELHPDTLMQTLTPYEEATIPAPQQMPDEPPVFPPRMDLGTFSYIDTLGIRLPVDFAIFYQVAQSTSGTESYSEGFTLIASILHKIVSSTVSEQT